MRNDLTGFDQIVLPEFALPWTAGLHPDVQATHVALVDWSERHGLLRDDAERERYAGYRFAWLAGRCFPAPTGCSPGGPPPLASQTARLHPRESPALAPCAARMSPWLTGLRACLDDRAPVAQGDP
ncbi:hypothetical protein [Actinocrispum wychmicini]|uniref:Uncharacterized protein n=1 Tax=Actinocrispum wychmicini TaxID=1213861 RepID=A0A4V2S3W5_9PSEU|nr:hypothetical protein [Actinocrispum wychmicini]TCO45900.1 hypothetical protein EV192_12086 [Actinocrispum wychmicini]